ncbi:MAG: alpha-amylase family protein [Fermentimonas sp.]|nr:alpha-amylase family protein [Fermentimonas sp.]MDD4697973.1 alpha-amylase family protein [Fermentimonas sp.]
MKKKYFIYQLLPRLFGNTNGTNVFNGSIEENGCGKFNNISFDVLKKIKDNGYTHVWYIGVLAHASVTDYSAFGIPKEYPELIKGKAGSPYAIRDYYDVDPDLAVNVQERMIEFEQLIRRTHEVGLKVIIDNVPNHVARNYISVSKPKHVSDFGENDDVTKSFTPKNNFYYLPGQPLEIQFRPGSISEHKYKEFPAKVTGNDSFTNKPTPNDWYDTVKLNYGVNYMNYKEEWFNPIPDTWNKMKDILMYWADKDVDGFRCDMAEMVPIAFWRWAIPQIKAKYPEFIFIAEIYNPSMYREYIDKNCFDYLYDKVGLYDVLRDVSCGYRPSSDITFTLNNVGDIQKKMLNFMENHDEQRIASDYFLKNGQKGKAAMIVTSCINSNPVMVYSGQEFGEKGMDEEGFSGKNGRTSIFDYWSPSTLRRWNNNGLWNETMLTSEEKDLARFYQNLINFCNDEGAISGGLFYDLMPANYENNEFDSTRLFAFLRGDEKDVLLVAVNFDGIERECTVEIPLHAFSFLNFKNKSHGLLIPLLNKSSDDVSFTYNKSSILKIGAHSGEIYRVSFT